MTDVDALDVFFESDVARYLENRLAPPEDKGRPELDASVVFFSRDYERELNDALDHDQISRAKQILHDLKARFDEAPNGTAEKNQAKTLLIGLYERFRMHLEHDDHPDRTDTDIARLMRSWGIQPIEPTTPEPPADLFAEESAPVSASPYREKRATPKPTVINRSMLDLVPEPVPEQKQSTRERDRLIAQTNELLTHVLAMLATGDIKGAASAYREARREVLAFDGGVPETLADSFFDTYTKINAAIDERRNNNVTSPERRTVASPSGKTTSAILPLPPSPTATPGSDPEFFDRAILAGIAQRKQELDVAVARQDFDGAARTYDAIRTAAMHIHDTRLREQTARKLTLLHALLTRLDQQRQSQDKHLTGGSP